MEHRRGDFASHPLAERELADRLIEQPLEEHQIHHRVPGPPIIRVGNIVDVAQQVESVGDRQIPPELSALAEDHPDPRDVTDSIAPRREPVHFASARQWLQDARENLDGGGFAGAVRSDEAEQLAAFEREADSLERLDDSIAALEQSLDAAPGAGRAFGNAIGFGQISNQNLRHRMSTGIDRGNRATYLTPRRQSNDARN